MNYVQLCRDPNCLTANETSLLVIVCWAVGFLAGALVMRTFRR